METLPRIERALTLEVRDVKPTGVERTFGLEEVIVSKTDPAGRITYANEVFCRLAGFTRDELLGAPHNLVRHPDMPRCVFKLLWDTVSSGHEIFAYVLNMSRNGDHYWVFAHVTPSFDSAGDIVGYHSNRRCPDKRAVETFSSLYADLVQIERSYPDRKEGLDASFQAVLDLLGSKGVSYDELVFSVTAA